MAYLRINGITFDTSVAIVDYEENVNVVDGSNAGRVKLKGRMIRDVIGTYIGHTVTVTELAGNHQGFVDFWNYIKLHSIDDSIMLEAADGDTTISYEAYYTSAKRKLKFGDTEHGKNYWDAVTVNFIPTEPQITP